MQAFDRCQTAPGQLSLSRFQHRTKPRDDTDTINEREVKLNLKTRPSSGICIIYFNSLIISGKSERSLGSFSATINENQIQTPDVFSPDTQVVIKQQHKIAGALKDMLEKRSRPADDIGNLPSMYFLNGYQIITKT